MDIPLLIVIIALTGAILMFSSLTLRSSLLLFKVLITIGFILLIGALLSTRVYDYYHRHCSYKYS